MMNTMFGGAAVSAADVVTTCVVDNMKIAAIIGRTCDMGFSLESENAIIFRPGSVLSYATSRKFPLQWNGLSGATNRALALPTVQEFV